jgi:hypothetical protein
VSPLQTLFAVILAATFLGSGLIKLTMPREKSAAGFLAYLEDLTDNQARSIGTVEIVAAACLLAALVSATARWLAAAAALVICLLMVGAAGTHLRRRELWILPLNLLLAGIALVLAFALSRPGA